MHRSCARSACQVNAGDDASGFKVAHYRDLRFLAKRVGLTGGLKSIEIQIGIQRRLAGMSGLLARGDEPFSLESRGPTFA